MSFIFSSESVNLIGTELYVSCRRDGEQVEYSLDLNSFIGNSDGSFDLNSEDFNSNSARIWFEDGHILHADLETSARAMIPATYDLNLSVAFDNLEGNLVFEKPNLSIRESCANFLLEGGVLKGICLGTDGKFHSSSIDLNYYVGNIDGVFVNWKRNFSLSARNVTLDTKDGICIQSQLCTETNGWKDAVYNVDKYIRNINGSFVFDHTTVAETSRLLITDYTRALLDLPFLDSEDKQVKQAIAVYVNSAPFTSCLRLCELFGGVLGAAVCAGLAATAENLIKKVKIGKEDSFSNEQSQTITLERAILKTLDNVLSDDAFLYLKLWLTTRLSTPSDDKRDIAAYNILKTVLQNRLKDVLSDDAKIATGDVDKATKIDDATPVQGVEPRPVDDGLDKKKDTLGSIPGNVPEQGILGGDREPADDRVNKNVDRLGTLQDTVRRPGWIKRRSS